MTGGGGGEEETISKREGKKIFFGHMLDT